MMLRGSLKGCVAVALFLAGPSLCHAGFITALTSTPNGTQGSTTGNRTYGWRFAVSEEIRVETLGLYFLGQHQGEREVGIWSTSSTTTPLATVGVTPPSSSFVGFHYNDLSSPLTLMPGTNYVIGAALASGDAFIADNNGMTFSSALDSTSSGIERLAFSTTATPELLYPGDENQREGYFGPNFQYTLPRAVPVPEPGSFAIFAAAICVAGVAGRRRRKQNVNKNG